MHGQLITVADFCTVLYEILIKSPNDNNQHKDIVYILVHTYIVSLGEVYIDIQSSVINRLSNWLTKSNIYSCTILPNTHAKEKCLEFQRKSQTSGISFWRSKMGKKSKKVKDVGESPQCCLVLFTISPNSLMQN